MTDNEKLEIQQTLSSKGWALILGLFLKEIDELRTPKNISSDKRYEDIAIETLSKAYAAKKLDKVLKEIINAKPTLKIKKEDFI